MIRQAIRQKNNQAIRQKNELVTGSNIQNPAKIGPLLHDNCSIIILSMMALFMGLAAEPFMIITGRIADQLLNLSIYIHAVLGQ